MADNTRAPLTPTEVWQEWFNAASEAWSNAFENLSGDQMPSAARQFAKSYLSYTETFR